ncbi:MAG TPA: tRNA preQ1(34) S-adenosylmethionine ribosyltransferase-isomerase QueA [Bacilli bacterium]|nr:tRNA preQ1(34) S-adenosylmethionine ribosyltransferase-isomerase QueA [Bacilli bacterium]
MDIDLFDYYLPESQIAQYPEQKRDDSRLLVANFFNKTYEDKHFYDIIDYLKPGDVLVRNNTKVIPARLIGTKVPTGARVEVLLLRQLDHSTWECLLGNAKAVRVGTKLAFGDGSLLTAHCVGSFDEGIRHLTFEFDGVFMEILERLGTIPLPPYIQDSAEKYASYQTVYAKVEGSAAAPTAGFHFTNELFARIKAKGIEVYDITLNIGLGTFRPVKVKDTKDHIMHSEYYSMEEDVAEKLNKAKGEGRRIIAIGTTSTRTLEAVMQKYGKFVGCSGSTDLFITPGYKFLGIDALITNFHLPKSTLVMLVSSLAGREFILACYNHAVRSGYRFFSFGDAMFIYGGKD